MVGMLLTEKSAETKHSQAMEFITLEDITALYDATLFPEVYRHCCHLSFILAKPTIDLQEAAHLDFSWTLDAADQPA